MRWMPLLLLLGCAAAEEATQADPPRVERVIPVRTAPIATEAVARPIHAVGRLKAADELPLSFPFGGIVANVNVEAGQRVQRGQLIATLDATAARATLTQAESALGKAERDLARATDLEGMVTTRQMTEDATTGVEVARAQKAAAAFQAERSRLVAPASGVILDRFIEDGQIVGPGTPVAALSSGGWELTVAVPSADAVRLAVGDAASVTFDAWPGVPFAATVLRRSGGASPLGAWSVTLSVESAGHSLGSGLIGAATLTPQGAEARTIPVAALAEADGPSGAVYAVVDGHAKRVPVQVAFLAGDRVALASGADDVAAVITDGLAFVIDGAAVAVAP